MLMEEGSVVPGRTMIEPPCTNVGSAEADRDQACVELRFVMDERDRLGRDARMAEAERDRLADTLRAVVAERDEARAGRAAAVAEQQRLSLENERLRADLAAAERVVALAKDEVAWLRSVTERFAADRDGGA
jgi:hypothetical protein